MCKDIHSVLEKKITLGTSRVVRCLRPHASTAGGVGSIPDWEAKILRAKVLMVCSEESGSLACCSSWGCKLLDTMSDLNNNSSL